MRVHPEIKGTRCWVWYGEVATKGTERRSLFNVENKRKVYAHRVAWFIETGKWPEPCACHKCDNPECVRFSHLFEGTHLENMQDMSAKGRSGNSKLTPKEVGDIRKRLTSGETIIKVAMKYSVSPSTVYMINRGEIWKQAA